MIHFDSSFLKIYGWLLKFQFGACSHEKIYGHISFVEDIVTDRESLIYPSESVQVPLTCYYWLFHLEYQNS